MSHQSLPQRPAGPIPSWPTAQQSAAVQRSFMVRVYAHLLGAIVAFIGVEWLLFTSGLAESFTRMVVNTNWLLVLAGFMVASWLAQRATVAGSRGTQYVGLLGLVGAYALIFTPMLYVTMAEGQQGLIGLAAGITLVGFVALSGIAITTAVDFSFMRSLLLWGGVVALGLIALGVFGLLELGTWFSVAMIGLAGGAVLHDTQRIRNLPPGNEVGAAASLFGSVAMIFFYVLRLLRR